MKMQKKQVGVRSGGGWGQGGCERRIEVIVKMQKRCGGTVGRGGGQGGCERRIEIIVKMQKSRGVGSGRGGGGVMVDANKELKLL